MNILVLGGAGYVGCVLVPELVLQGHRVKVIDWGAFGDGIGYIASLPLVELIQADTRTLSDLDFVGQEVVVDLAAISNDPAGELDPSLTWEVNCHARRKNSMISCRAGVRQYILASSCSVYGVVKEGAISNEESPMNPQTTYAEAAVEAERMVASQHPSSIILRQATLYGVSPRMRWDVVVNKWARDLYRKSPLVIFSQRTWRPFLHVRDTVSVINLVINSSNLITIGQPYNLVGENYRIDHLIEDLLQEFGGVWQASFDESDSRSYRVSGRKLQDALNWYPQWTVKDGIQEIHQILRSGWGNINPDSPTTLDVYREFLRCHHT